MKIIATSDELKDLRNLFIQGFTSLDDKDRTELEDKIKDLENTIDYKNTFIDSLNDDKSIMLKTQVDLNNTNKNLKNQLNLQYKKESDINKDLLILNDLSEADIKRHCNRNEELIGDITKLSKEIDNLNLENSKVYHRNKELEEASKKFIDLNTKLNFDVKNLSEYKTIKDKEFDNLSKSFDELWNDRDELRKAGSRMKKELEIAYSLAELRLKEINGLINNKVEIIRVLDKYAGDTQPGTKYININVLKDIKQYL